MTFRFIAARAVLLSTLICLAFTGTAEARWLRAETPLFILYSEGGEGQLRDLAKNLHAYDELLRLATSTPPAAEQNKLTIYLVGSKAGIRDVRPSMSRDIAGFYQATIGGTAAVVVRNGVGDGGWAPARAFIFHEYTHHFVAQYHPSSYPTWFNEGLAEYFSTTEFKKDGAFVGDGMAMRAYVFGTNVLLPTEKVLRGDADARRADMFYSQSWLMVHYMMDDNARSQKLFEYLKALSEGQDPVSAFTATFNMTPAAFDKELAGYLRKNKIIVRRFAVTADKPVEISIAAMPASADDLLLMNARLLLGSERPEDRAGVLDTVRDNAAKFPDDALALRTLALAELENAHYEQADAVLDKVLAADPKDTQALFIKAIRYFGPDNTGPRETLWRQARAPLVALHKLDQNHAAGLYLYALTYLGETEKPSENIINIVVQAHLLAPQVDQFRIEAGIALYRSGDTDAGKKLVQGAATSVHASPVAKYARSILAKMEAGETVEQPLGGFAEEDEDEDEEEKEKEAPK